MMAFLYSTPQGISVTVPQSPSPATWQPRRPMPYPTASAGAAISAPLSHGILFFFTTQLTAKTPPKKPPYHVKPAPVKIYLHGERKKLRHLSMMKRMRAPDNPPTAAAKTIVEANSRL